MSKKRTIKRIAKWNLDGQHEDLLSFLDGIRQDIDTFLTEQAGTGENHPNRNGAGHDAIPDVPGQPRDDALTVKVFLPGLDKNHIEIVVIDDDLIVQAQYAHRAEANTPPGMSTSGEWMLWRMSLPPAIDPGSIQAACENNLLTVVVPMQPSTTSNPATIPVRVQQRSQVVPPLSTQPVLS